MSIPNQNILLRHNAPTKRGKKKKHKNQAAFKAPVPVRPNMPKFTAYRYVTPINTLPPVQFQTPQHGELVDLTDDVAPEMSVSNTVYAAQPESTTPNPASGSDNKLNFKFQKTTAKNTPDWTKYQNNFKLISQASPDSDQGEQVDEKNKTTEAQKETVDLTDQDNNDDTLLGLPQSVMDIVKQKLKELPGKKPIIMPKLEDPPPVKQPPTQNKNLTNIKSRFAEDLKLEGDCKPKATNPKDANKAAQKVVKPATQTVIENANKAAQKVIKPATQTVIENANKAAQKVIKPATKTVTETVNQPVNLNPIKVLVPSVKQTQSAAPKPKGQPTYPGHKGPSGSIYDYPNKGIPRLFLLQKEKEMNTAGSNKQFTPAIKKPTTPVYDYPKGIPRSFLTKQDLEKYKIDVPNQPSPVPPVQNTGIPRSFLKEQEYKKHEVEPHDQPSLQNAVPEYQLPSCLDLPSWILGSQPNPQPAKESSTYEELESEPVPNTPMFAQHEPIPNRPYSPSDVYVETAEKAEEAHEGSESPDMLQSGQKRLSAFQRLGPLTKPKKPKLTINLMVNKEQSVREVVDETTESFRFVPVHLRRDVLESEDELVKKYLPVWPWKKKFVVRKTVSVRHSKSVMILEQEQMETAYEKENMFIHVSVKGYPVSWTKEDVLDAILECVKGKSFIPCFIEFTPQECKFLVIRSRGALVVLHKVGFCVRAADTELTVTIALTETSLKQLDLIPRLVLRRRLLANETEGSLDLSNFLLGSDVSHFVYFPLNRVTNQVELIHLQSTVAWECLTELNLSKNRITTFDGFDFQTTTPKLRHLDLSHNLLDKVTVLLKCRDLPLRSIRLEGNPLCLDYIDSAHYVKVVKMIFSGLRELDGVPLTFKGDLPPSKRNYCPEDAAGIAGKFLETFFPLLEAPSDDRAAIERMYDKDAVMTVTFRHKLRYGSAFRYFRNLFVRSRNLEEGDMESIRGAPSIGDLVSKWPPIEHDRYTITVDVMHHDESTTILRTGGMLKLTAETLAEDEHLLTFTRTVVLHSRNGTEYKIHNEMLYWDVPSEKYAMTAFNITMVRPKQKLTLKLESPPDEELKSKLLSIFVKLADIDKKRGERCLKKKNWDLRSALDYYVILLKLDDLSPLNEPEKETTPVPQTS